MLFGKRNNLELSVFHRLARSYRSPATAKAQGRGGSSLFAPRRGSPPQNDSRRAYRKMESESVVAKLILGEF